MRSILRASPVLGLVAAVAASLAVAPRAGADTVAASVNGNAFPSFLFHCATCPSSGWYYTPTTTFRLSGIRTIFRGVIQPGSEDRAVTVEVLSERRQLGGVVLASATFESSEARDTLAGVNFPNPILLQAGTKYFIGFRNVAGLGVNVTLDPSATVLAPGWFLDTDGVNDGSYDVAVNDPSPAALAAPILRFLTPDDTDGDGVLDPFDVCPTVANPNQADANGDGVGDACSDLSVPREPNNTIASATPVTCGFTSSGATISPLKDVDFYRFQAAAGTIVTLDVDAQVLGSSLDSELAIFDASGNRLQFSTDQVTGQGVTSDSYLQYALPTAGTYYVAVGSFPDRDFSGDSDFTSGPYTLKLGCSPPDPYEPNATIAQAKPLACETATQATQIAPSDDVDVYAVTVAAGGRIRLDLDTPAGSGLDSQLALKRANGSFVASSDNDAAPGEVLGTDSYLSYDSTSAQTLYVEVKSGLLTAGPYTLNVSCGSTDPTEPNDTRAQATPLACGTFAPAGTALNPPGDVDFFQVTVATPSVISANLDPGGRFRPNLVDSTLGLYDASGKLVAVNDDGAAKDEFLLMDSYLSKAVPAGTYTLAVSSFDDFNFDGQSDSGNETIGTGEYRLSVGCVAQPARPIRETPWPALDGGIGGPLLGSKTFDLAFPFPFFGRTIRSLEVSTTGLVELLESGESCKICGESAAFSSGAYVTRAIDGLFAAEGDLVSGVTVHSDGDRVRILWIGHRAQDAFEANSLLFELVLEKSGRVRWKFYQMDPASSATDLFSGLYDGVGKTLRAIPGGTASLVGPVHRAFEFVPGAPAIVEVPWLASDLHLDVADDASSTFTLPSAFSFRGRSYQKIQVNTNGLVELLSGPETCSECQLPLTHAAGRAAAQGLDVVFAANDDLVSGAVLEITPERVEIDWIGHTKVDGVLFGKGIEFGLVLTKGGGALWRFYDMAWEGRSGDLFSGFYDPAPAQGEFEVELKSLNLFHAPENRAFGFGTDTDGDGIADVADDCITRANPSQLDTDNDGYGNACDPDFNNDGIVNFADLARMKQVFFQAEPVADLDESGVVNFTDLARLKLYFFKPPGPSGRKPAN